MIILPEEALPLVRIHFPRWRSCLAKGRAASKILQSVKNYYRDFPKCYKVLRKKRLNFHSVITETTVIVVITGSAMNSTTSVIWFFKVLKKMEIIWKFKIPPKWRKDSFFCTSAEVPHGIFDMPTCVLQYILTETWAQN